MTHVRKQFHWTFATSNFCDNFFIHPLPSLHFPLLIPYYQEVNYTSRGKFWIKMEMEFGSWEWIMENENMEGIDPKYN